MSEHSTASSSYEYQFDPGSAADEDSIFAGINIDQFAAFGSSSYTSNRAPTRSIDSMGSTAGPPGSGVIQFCFEEDSLGAPRRGSGRGRLGSNGAASFSDDSCVATPSSVEDDGVRMVHVDAVTNEPVISQQADAPRRGGRSVSFSSLFQAALLAFTMTFLGIELNNRGGHEQQHLRHGNQEVVDNNRALLVPNVDDMDDGNSEERQLPKREIHDGVYYLDNDLPWANDLPNKRKLLDLEPQSEAYNKLLRKRKKPNRPTGSRVPNKAPNRAPSKEMKSDKSKKKPSKPNKKPDKSKKKPSKDKDKIKDKAKDKKSKKKPSEDKDDKPKKPDKKPVKQPNTNTKPPNKKNPDKNK